MAYLERIYELRNVKGRHSVENVDKVSLLKPISEIYTIFNKVNLTKIKNRGLKYSFG